LELGPDIKSASIPIHDQLKDTDFALFKKADVGLPEKLKSGILRRFSISAKSRQAQFAHSEMD
jgi:hypothetical protein